MEALHYSLYLLIMIQSVLIARGHGNSTYDSVWKHISGCDYAA